MIEPFSSDLKSPFGSHLIVNSRGSFRAVSEQFYDRTIFERFAISSWDPLDRSLSVQFQSSFRAVSEQLQDSFRAILEPFYNDLKSLIRSHLMVNSRYNFRASSEQFQCRLGALPRFDLVFGAFGHPFRCCSGAVSRPSLTEIVCLL